MVEYGPEARRRAPLRLVQACTLVQPLVGSVSIRCPHTRRTQRVRPGEALLLRIGAHEVLEHPSASGELSLRLVCLGDAALEYGVPNAMVRERSGGDVLASPHAQATLPTWLGERLLALPANHDAADLADNALAVFAPLVGDLAHAGFGDLLVDCLRSARLDPCSKLRQLMHENVYQPLTLEDYATLCTRSTSSFKRDFQRAFGMPPGRWITDARLHRAREVLRAGDMSVAEVGLLAGYADASSFIRSFRRRFGITPKRYQLRSLPSGTSAAPSKAVGFGDELVG